MLVSELVLVRKVAHELVALVFGETGPQAERSFVEEERICATSFCYRSCRGFDWRRVARCRPSLGDAGEDLIGLGCPSRKTVNNDSVPPL